MVSMIQQTAKQTAQKGVQDLEENLLPSEFPDKRSAVTKTIVYALQLPQWVDGPPGVADTSCFSWVVNLFSGKTKELPLVEFAKRPVWDERGVDAAPVEIGFASADFQDNGPKIHPNTNWGNFYKTQKKEQLELNAQTPDIWNHPERVIDRLLELGVKKYRFSLSRDKIEPQPGVFDETALEHYAHFCALLQRNGIEPMATLHHFSDPDYFSWEKKENVAGFVRYCEKAADLLHQAGVRQILTINEPGVIGFQGWCMGEFPPHKIRDLPMMGRVMENMLRAHTLVYDAVKTKHPDLEIGISHDPIRFRPYHKSNPFLAPIEKFVCHYLTELNHTAFMRFLQTGEYSLKVPFLSNHCFSLGKKPPFDFIGLQYYSDPLIDLLRTKQGSVTRVPGEKTSSYQFRMYPQGLASALEECREFNVPIDLTEIGMDTGVNKQENDDERIRYFDRIFQVVQKALENNIPIRSVYFWTLIDNLEWYKAWAVRFGFYKFDPATGHISSRGAARWLKTRIEKRALTVSKAI